MRSRAGRISFRDSSKGFSGPHPESGGKVRPFLFAGSDNKGLTRKDTDMISNLIDQPAKAAEDSLNMTASEIISTYTYKVGLMDAKYSYSTAIGLFNNVVNFVILILVNQFSRKVSDTSLF